MTRPWGPRALIASMLALLMAMAAIVQPAATMAQATSQTVGSSTITPSADWAFQADISDSSSAFYSHSQLSGTLFIYGEIADPTVTDADGALEDFATGFFGEFGDKNEALVTSGTLTSDPDTAWRLYSVDQSGIPYGMLVTGNIAKVPGSVVVSVLIGPAGSFDMAITAVQSGIDINGAGSPFAEFDAAQLNTALEGGAVPGTETPVAGTETPVAGTTPQGGLTLPPLNSTPAGTETPVATETQAATETAVAGTTPQGGLTLPPLNSTPAGTETPVATETQVATETPVTGTTGQAQTVVVNGVTVGYAAPWIYEQGISTPDELAFFSHDTSQTTLFGYAATAVDSNDAAGSLSQFNDGFFGSFGATNVQQVTLETLPSGHAWSLHTADKDGTPIVFLAVADVTTAPGEFRVQVLLTPAAEFSATLPDTKASFQIDGTPALNELDPATVIPMVGGGTTGATTPTEVATEVATTAPTETTTAGTTTNPGTTLTVAGDTSQFEAQDTQGSCDALGWAATGPDQIPSTEQDLNYRASCVGGGSYFAACGTAAPTDLGTPEPGMIWIQCDVTVRVDGAPLTLTMFDFELNDATGTVYTFDLLAALASIQNVQIFPEEPIATGQTATGSVLFSVPETAGASGPWVLTVKPASLQTTGEQPGQIVVAGELQPFSAAAAQ